MPHFHCRKCHHEFEASKPIDCDWCGADRPRVLEETTPLQRLIREMIQDGRMRSPEAVHP